MNTIDRYIRLATELRDLRDKAEKLEAFLEDDTRGAVVEEYERGLMVSQLAHMKHYAKYLTYRVGLTARKLEAELK